MMTPMTNDHTAPLNVDEAQIAELVRVFYAQARAHPSLGALFNSAVSDWEQHLGVVHDFWSHVLLRTDRYKGHPYPVHTGLPIKREHFGQWLDLFRPVAERTLPPEAAARAIARAEHMAESFKAGLYPFDPVEARRTG